MNTLEKAAREYARIKPDVFILAEQQNFLLELYNVL